MAVTINADTTNGLVITPDTSGEIELQQNGTKMIKFGADGLELPQWTTAGRPASPSQGYIGFNTTTGEPEWYDSGNSEWIKFRQALSYNVDFLVVAGGGSGGAHAGSAGGAGGYRTSFGTGNISGGGSVVETALKFEPDTIYTITVGAGASSRVNANGGTGGNSSIAGSGISTITSLGGAGGRGGASTGAGFSGGSGSGGAGSSGSHAGGSGTSGQGYAGGTSVNNWATGGGGGAGAVGGSGSGSNAGNGGAGLASSITGSSVTRAGGGGGSPQTGSAGSGGSGGGGAGGVGSAVAGAANTGSGGGGVHSSSAGSGAGGSGVVILRIPTASYSGTQSGATVTTSGSDTILTFNSSGSYTG
jgi:hypothetical protein